MIVILAGATCCAVKHRNWRHTVFAMLCWLVATKEKEKEKYQRTICLYHPMTYLTLILYYSTTRMHMLSRICFVYVCVNCTVKFKVYCSLVFHSCIAGLRGPGQHVSENWYRTGCLIYKSLTVIPRSSGLHSERHFRGKSRVTADQYLSCDWIYERNGWPFQTVIGLLACWLPGLAIISTSAPNVKPSLCSCSKSRFCIALCSCSNIFLSVGSWPTCAWLYFYDFLLE